MNFTRASGVLLHPTSLPGRFGMGSLGDEAYRFADFLVGAKQHLWQVLPLGPTSCTNSPYDCFSAFAGNPLLISLENLAEDGLLEPADLEDAPSFPDNRVDHDRVGEFKMTLLRRSFAVFESSAGQKQSADFEAFCERNASWLDAYSLFMALRCSRDGGPWNTWEEDIRRLDPGAVERWRDKLAREETFHKYMQYQFFRQWSEFKRYCNERGLSIIGDIAHFVALDSAEVWWHQDMFRLDVDGTPAVVSGVPPDCFSKTGQLWGNPVYRWEKMAGDRYSWWVERLRAARALADIIRLDHFRGFEQYWEVPAGDTTAMNGRWAPGPGAGLFEELQGSLGHISIIAEDLGTITPEVHALRERFGFPGMRVLQFAFDSDDRLNPHKPHNYSRDCVVYTGTHDNDTTIGWFNGGMNASGAEDMKGRRQRVLKYLGATEREINWAFIRLAFASVADMAVVPLQDVLGLGSEARMNTPGTTLGNWEWRFTSGMLTDAIAGRLADLSEIYDR
jgi:4-alpha-glucanotransferase